MKSHNCGSCGYAGGADNSFPPQYKCEITKESHDFLYECDCDKFITVFDYIRQRCNYNEI